MEAELPLLGNPCIVIGWNVSFSEERFTRGKFSNREVALRYTNNAEAGVSIIVFYISKSQQVAY